MVEGRLHGIARYALALANELPLLEPHWEFVGLTAPQGLPSDLGPALQPRIRCVPARARFLSVLEQPTLPVDLLEGRCDLFHATSFSVPLLSPVPLVATLHDANHLALGEEYSPAQTLYYRTIVGPRCQRARALITVSEFSRWELERHLGIASANFQVIPPGVHDVFRRLTSTEQEQARRMLGLPERYLAAVGNDKAFKNLELLAKLSHRIQVPLVLIARPEVKEHLAFHPRTQVLPQLREENLPKFFASAAAVLVPSRYEGFGLPALEAMACAVPVLASNNSALPEVVGDAGILLPPHEVDAWVRACEQILTESTQAREARVEVGLERAARMTWKLCAQRTLEVYRRAL
jgi:glycosyltransferase involved in cell wall biosynthesis